MHHEPIHQRALFEEASAGHVSLQAEHGGSVPRELMVHWGRVRHRTLLTGDERASVFARMSQDLAPHGLVVANTMNIFVALPTSWALQPADQQVLVDWLSKEPQTSWFEVSEPVPLVGLATGEVPMGIKGLERLSVRDAQTFRTLILLVCHRAVQLSLGPPDAGPGDLQRLMNL